MWSTNYRADIDGLRALAVVLVVIGHTGLGLSGGFVGVDVFFVISGFLITRLLLSSYENHIPLTNFWIRRIRRIVPAASVAVAATLMIGMCVLSPRELHLLGQSAIAPQLGYSNMYFWSHGGYFDLPSEQQPLLHTWSLAVEEQYYLVWPLILLLAWKKKVVVPAIVGLGVTSLAASELLVQSHPSTAFYFMPTRMWELLLGAAALFLPQLRGIFGPIGMTLILVSAACYTESTPFPGLTALAPCVGTAAIILSRSWITRLLSLRPIVYIGKMSYSVYLWHWPIWVFTKNPTLTVVASLLIGSLSYELIETPIRSRSFLKDNRRLIWSCACVEGLICLTGYLTYSHLKSEYVEMSPGGTQRLGAPGVPRFVLWGDSHALAAAKAFDDLAKERGIAGQCFGLVGIPPLLGTYNDRMQRNLIPISREDQIAWNQHVIQWINDHEIADIFIVGRWDSRVPSKLGNDYVASRLLQDGSSKEFSTTDSRRAFEDGLDRTLDALKGKHVYFLMQVPAMERDDAPITRQTYELQRFEVNQVLKARSGSLFHVLGPGEWFKNDLLVIRDEGGGYYMDKDHVSPYGAKKMISPLLEPVFKEISDRVRDSQLQKGAVDTTRPH
jgi:peptidoglycan/LPS O-acetylase OafA/YrhL